MIEDCRLFTDWSVRCSAPRLSSSLFSAPLYFRRGRPPGSAAPCPSESARHQARARSKEAQRDRDGTHPRTSDRRRERRATATGPVQLAGEGIEGDASASTDENGRYEIKDSAGEPRAGSAARAATRGAVRTAAALQPSGRPMQPSTGLPPRGACSRSAHTCCHSPRWTRGTGRRIEGRFQTAAWWCLPAASPTGLVNRR